MAGRLRNWKSLLRSGMWLLWLDLGLFALVLILWLYYFEWTGFDQAFNPPKQDRDFRPYKTLWDWMQLLIVPAVLAAGATVAGALFNRTERAREERQRTAEQEREERQRQVDREREDRERGAEIERAENRERAEALETYLDRMSELLLKERLAEPSDEQATVRNVALARTLTAISRLDGSRNGHLLKFLQDTRLIVGESPIISLSQADLTRADLSKIDLRETNLSEANLSDAFLIKG